MPRCNHRVGIYLAHQTAWSTKISKEIAPCMPSEGTSTTKALRQSSVHFAITEAIDDCKWGGIKVEGSNTSHSGNQELAPPGKKEYPLRNKISAAMITTGEVPSGEGEGSREGRIAIDSAAWSFAIPSMSSQERIGDGAQSIRLPMVTKNAFD